MKTYAIIDPQTGRVAQTVTWPIALGEPGIIPGYEQFDQIEVPAGFDNSRQYIAEGMVVDMPTKPGIDHTFDWLTHQWIDHRTVQTEWVAVRAKRDLLLANNDWRVLRAVDTGVPLSQAWITYRQALRDVTAQADPFNITWPAIPTE